MTSMPASISGGGGGSPTVKTVDWKAGGRIDRGRDGSARVRGPAESVLRAEQRHEPDASRPQSHHVTGSFGVHAGLVGHQPDPPVADQTGRCR